MKYTTEGKGREYEGVGRGQCVCTVMLDTNDKEIEKEVERKENFLPSGSLNTKPPTVLLLLL